MLETGDTPDGDSVGGGMAKVVKNTAQLSPEDRAAIAAYVKSLPPDYVNNGKPISPDLHGGGENLRFKDFVVLPYSAEMFLATLIYDGFYPALVGFNSIPKVAVIPILVIWFGIGTVPAIITAFLISFFPILVNVATGIATVEPELKDVLRALGATL